MQLHLHNDKEHTRVTIADRKGSLGTFINGSATYIEHMGDNMFRYFDSQFLVLLESEAEAIIKDNLTDEFGLPPSEIDALYREDERALALSIDGEEHIEGIFLIYRVN